MSKVRNPIFIPNSASVKGCSFLSELWLSLFRYVKSRSDKQLRSKKFENEVEDCKPETNAKAGSIVPCGLIAWSLFNDTYGFSKNNRTIQVNKKGIAWKSDRQHKFGSDVYPKNFQQGWIGGAKLDENVPVCIYFTYFTFLCLSRLFFLNLVFHIFPFCFHFFIFILYLIVK